MAPAAAALKPFQKSALAALSVPVHLVCVAPTGSGKSRIYEEFVARNRPRALLFSPLVALSRQHSCLLEERRIRTFGRFTRDGRKGSPVVLPSWRESGVWILSPESLLSQTTSRRIERWQPEFLIMDECHTCWDWGESFRPALRRTLALLREFTIPRSLWLTATLPWAAREFLASQLPDPKLFQGRFELPPGLELRTSRVPWSERAEALMRWLELRPEPGIVFVATRSAAEQVRALISRSGRVAFAYHAGLSAEERGAIERMLRRGDALVVVATSAFGMGMHFPQLAWALLWQAPPSLLALAQAVGRVGRGAERSWATLFWDEDDFRAVEWMAGTSDERGRALREVRDFLTTSSPLTQAFMTSRQ